MTHELIDYNNREMLQTLKETVAQELNDSEFKLFVEHCKSTNLNPFKREVWAIKASGRLQVMTGINGFLAIANGHPEFDGMEVEVDSDDHPTRAVCRVYRKDRRIASEGVALMKEYRRESPIWKKMPRVMLTKVAKSIALREAFPQELNGLYTAEEMPAEYDVHHAAEKKQNYEKPTPLEIAEYTVEVESSDVFFYKIYPKMENFEELKAIIKRAGGKWHPAGKCWKVDQAIQEVAAQECDESGQWLNSKKKANVKKEPVVEMEEAPPWVQEDVPLEDDDFSF
jgi:phage recombination protein Bet